jgi:hypothetical protein
MTIPEKKPTFETFAYNLVENYEDIENKFIIKCQNDLFHFYMKLEGLSSRKLAKRLENTETPLNYKQIQARVRSGAEIFERLYSLISLIELKIKGDDKLIGKHLQHIISMMILSYKPREFDKICKEEGFSKIRINQMKKFRKQIKKNEEELL